MGEREMVKSEHKHCWVGNFVVRPQEESEPTPSAIGTTN